MKNTIALFVSICCAVSMAFAQPSPVKTVKNANRFTYEVYDYGESIDTSLMQIVYHSPFYRIYTIGEEGPFVPGYAQETTVVNLKTDSIYHRAVFQNGNQKEHYEVVSSFIRRDIAYDTARVGGLTRYTCHINSNTLEFFVQDFPYDLNPVPSYGRFPSLDWRTLAEPVFFVFAFHSMVTRVLTKVAAQWLMGHQVGSAGFLCAHLLDATIAVAVSLLVYHLLKHLFPNTCRWLFGKPRLWRK